MEPDGNIIEKFVRVNGDIKGDHVRNMHSNGQVSEIIPRDQKASKYYHIQNPFN